MPNEIQRHGLFRNAHLYDLYDIRSEKLHDTSSQTQQSNYNYIRFSWSEDTKAYLFKEPCVHFGQLGIEEELKVCLLSEIIEPQDRTEFMKFLMDLADMKPDTHKVAIVTKYSAAYEDEAARSYLTKIPTHLSPNATHAVVKIKFTLIEVIVLEYRSNTEDPEHIAQRDAEAVIVLIQDSIKYYRSSVTIDREMEKYKMALVGYFNNLENIFIQNISFDKLLQFTNSFRSRKTSYEISHGRQEQITLRPIEEVFPNLSFGASISTTPVAQVRQLKDEFEALMRDLIIIRRHIVTLNDDKHLREIQNSREFRASFQELFDHLAETHKGVQEEYKFILANIKKSYIEYQSKGDLSIIESAKISCKDFYKQAEVHQSLIESVKKRYYVWSKSIEVFEKLGIQALTNESKNVNSFYVFTFDSNALLEQSDEWKWHLGCFISLVMREGLSCFYCVYPEFKKIFPETNAEQSGEKVQIYKWEEN